MTGKTTNKFSPEVRERAVRMVLDGAVQLESSDGLVAKTESANYSQAEGILRAPGAASFTRGRMSGSAACRKDRRRGPAAFSSATGISAAPGRMRWTSSAPVPSVP